MTERTQDSFGFESHFLREVVARFDGLALGYEDLNDHGQLREDPLLALLSGKKQVGEAPLAGKSTLNRLELSTEPPSRPQEDSLPAGSGGQAAGGPLSGSA